MIECDFPEGETVFKEVSIAVKKAIDDYEAGERFVSDEELRNRFEI